jgi:hypothetical protein
MTSSRNMFTNKKKRYIQMNAIASLEGKGLLICMKTTYDAIESLVVYDVEATRHH